MAEIPFSPPTVLNIVKASLPQGPEAAPPLKSPYDAVAIFTHACMLSVGFRLVGLSEDDNLGTIKLLNHCYLVTVMLTAYHRNTHRRLESKTASTKLERLSWELRLPICTLAIVFTVPDKGEPSREQSCSNGFGNRRR